MNYMGQVAKMLGVELGEEFAIEGNPNTFYLSERGLFLKGNEFEISLYSILGRLLCGGYTIKKKQYKPLPNEKYWAFQCTQGEVELQYLKWRDDHIDNTLYKIGDCYPTQEAAEQHRPQWEAFFADRDQVDVLGGTK